MDIFLVWRIDDNGYDDDRTEEIIDCFKTKEAAEKFIFGLEHSLIILQGEKCANCIVYRINPAHYEKCKNDILNYCPHAEVKASNSNPDFLICKNDTSEDFIEQSIYRIQKISAR